MCLCVCGSYYGRIEREVLSLVQSDLLAASGSPSSSDSFEATAPEGAPGPASLSGAGNALPPRAAAGPAVRATQSSAHALGRLFLPDFEAEAEHFGAPEAVAIRPHLKWSHTALALFHLLDVLLQHNVHALVHDTLCFYAVHRAQVDAEQQALAGTASDRESGGGPLPFARMVRTPPQALQLQAGPTNHGQGAARPGSNEGDDAGPPQQAPLATTSVSGSGAGGGGGGGGNGAPDRSLRLVPRSFGRSLGPGASVAEPWRDRLSRLLHSRLLSTTATPLATSTGVLVDLCRHPSPAIVSAAYNHLMNMFQEQRYLATALEACTLQGEWPGTSTTQQEQEQEPEAAADAGPSGSQVGVGIGSWASSGSTGPGKDEAAGNGPFNTGAPAPLTVDLDLDSLGANQLRTPRSIPQALPVDPTSGQVALAPFGPGDASDKGDPVDTRPLALTPDQAKLGTQFLGAAARLVQGQAQAAFDRLLHVYHQNLAVHLPPIGRATEGSLFGLGLGQASSHADQTQAGTQTSSGSSPGATSESLDPPPGAVPRASTANFVVDLVRHLTRAVAPEGSDGSTSNSGAADEDGALSINPALAVKLVHLLRCLVRHVLLQDLFDGKISLEDGVASSVEVTEDNMHTLYRHTVLRVVTSTTLARFQSLEGEDMQERLSASVALRLRDFLESHGASALVSALLTFALRVVQQEGGDGGEVGSTEAPGDGGVGVGGEDEGHDSSPVRDQQRNMGLRLLYEASQLGRWLVFDANTPVQESMMLSLVRVQGVASGEADAAPSGGMEGVPSSGSHPSGSSSARAHASAHWQGPLPHLRDLVLHVSSAVAVRRTLFSERPEIMTMFTQSAKAIAARGGVRGGPIGSGAGALGPSPLAEPEELQQQQEQQRLKLLQLQEMFEAGTDDAQDVSATLALADSEDDNNVMDDEVGSHAPLARAWLSVADVLVRRLMCARACTRRRASAGGY